MAGISKELTSGDTNTPWRGVKPAGAMLFLKRVAEPLSPLGVIAWIFQPTIRVVLYALPPGVL